MRRLGLAVAGMIVAGLAQAASLTVQGTLSSQGGSSSCTYSSIAETANGDWTVTCGNGSKTLSIQPPLTGTTCSAYASIAEDVSGGWVVSGCVSAGPATTIYYVHPDHLGTPRVITRASDNQAVWRWDNGEVFGDSAPNENPSGLGSFGYNLRFPGQYFDSETGTTYNYWRQYDASLGRYLQSDPMGISSGLNTFAYVAGHPLTSIDDFGLAECSNITCFPGFRNRRLISSKTSNPTPWALENIHIEPIDSPPFPPTRFAGMLPLDINFGREHGSCTFARYRDIDEVWGIYRQYACLQVCTADCGKPYSRWAIEEALENTEDKRRRDREQFVKNFSAAIVALECRKFLDSMR